MAPSEITIFRSRLPDPNLKKSEKYLFEKKHWTYFTSHKTTLLRCANIYNGLLWNIKKQGGGEETDVSKKIQIT